MTEVKSIMNDYGEVIQNWLKDLTDVEVVFGDRSDPQPDKPYISFKLLTGLIKVGSHDEIIPGISAPNPDDDVPAKVKHNRNFTCSITAVGRYDNDSDEYVRAPDILAQVQNSLGLQDTKDRFRAVGLSIREENVISDASVFLDTETESRAILDILFGAAMYSEDDPGFIETVEVEGNLDSDQDGVADDVQISETVTAS